MQKLKANNTIQVQFITSSNCPECIQAKRILDEVKMYLPNLEIQEYDVMGLKGLELAVKHGIMANPGIIISGELFSVGSLDKEKFLRKIRALQKSS